jgi:hypothetical protein
MRTLKPPTARCGTSCSRRRHPVLHAGRRRARPHPRRRFPAVPIDRGGHSGHLRPRSALSTHQARSSAIEDELLEVSNLLFEGDPLFTDDADHWAESLMTVATMLTCSHRVTRALEQLRDVVVELVPAAPEA